MKNSGGEIETEKPGAALTATSTNGLVFRLMGHAMGRFKQDEWRVSTEMDVCLKVLEFMRMKYAVSEKTFTKLATDRRWHAMNPADAVGLLKKEYDKHSKVAKRQWVVQNAPELIEEYKKFLRQEGR